MRRDLLSVVQLGFSFALIFSAFNSQGLIEVSVLRAKAKSSPDEGITEKSGSYSLSIIYLFFTITNLIVPPVVKKLGPKFSQIIGATGYLLFMAAFLKLNVYLLYLSSAALGAGAALLWAGNGVYIIEISRKHKLERNSGIMWAMLQSSLITGGCFLIYVLKSSDLSNSYIFIYTVFSCLTALGIVVLMFLPNSPSQYGNQNQEIGEDSIDDTQQLLANDEDVELTVSQQMKNMYTLFLSPNMLSLLILFAYSGIEMTFYSGVFTSCLSATLHLKEFSDLLVPFSALAIGTGQISGGLMTGLANKLFKFKTRTFVIFATLGHLFSFGLCFLSLPSDSTIHPTDASSYINPNLLSILCISFFMGFSDALWQTQIYVTIGNNFQEDPISAFAIFKFVQSLAACISFFYSSFLLLSWQLLLLSTACVLSAYCFFKVGKRSENEDSS